MCLANATTSTCPKVMAQANQGLYKAGLSAQALLLCSLCIITCEVLDNRSFKGVHGCNAWTLPLIVVAAKQVNVAANTLFAVLHLLR